MIQTYQIKQRIILSKLRLQSTRTFQASRAVHAHDGDSYRKDRVTAFVGHNFPDFIDHWSRNTFYRVGYGLSAVTALSFVGPVISMSTVPMNYVPAAILVTLTTGYWRIGLRDIRQTSHAIRRNYPVLGNFRYIFETIRPELRQYIVESDSDGRPFDRLHRNQVYQRAKNVDDTMPYGTRRNVYEVHHEWACHSMWPQAVMDDEASRRCSIGTTEYGTKQPYSASVFNISGMSYGAISDNAILALNKGAKMGNFYHNTGEGGVSKFHMQGGGDIVWNVGTGYFGCGTGTGKQRQFDPIQMKERLEEAQGRIKMIEIKLSQGAKPGKGGVLPQAKITKEIAEARKLDFPATSDCHSPPRHSAFGNAHELVEFIMNVRDITGGLPVGIKMCVGEPGDVGTLCKAMVELGNGPDFITVDGAEGGTGAAPPELSDSVGLPLEEGLVTVRNMLIGAGLKDKTVINASGRITSGFALVRTLALGADVASAARAFMLSIGCIQALKCNTNKCPTGVATLDKNLMYGLDPEVKSNRVFYFHHKTVDAAANIVGIMGRTSFADVSSNDVMRRITADKVRTLAEHFPSVEVGSLLRGEAPERMQEVWDQSGTKHVSTRRWIY